MPIEVPPIPTQKIVAEPLTANAIYLDRVSIDGSGHDERPPTVEVVVRPFAAGTPNVYADETWTLNTANVYAAAQRIPEIGAAIQAMFAAAKAWHEYDAQREKDIAAATQQRDAAAQIEATAKATLDEAAATRSAAFAARPTDEAGDPVLDDPAWLAADAAWQQAESVHQAAAAALATANERVAIAAAALADPANPPLED